MGGMDLGLASSRSCMDEICIGLGLSVKVFVCTLQWRLYYSKSDQSKAASPFPRFPLFPDAVDPQMPFLSRLRQSRQFHLLVSPLAVLSLNEAVVVVKSGREDKTLIGCVLGSAGSWSMKKSLLLLLLILL